MRSALVVFLAAVIGVGAGCSSEHRAARRPATTDGAATRSARPNAIPRCAQKRSTIIGRPGTFVWNPASFDPTVAARQAFGPRFGGIWLGRTLLHGVDTPVVFVSVAHPTAADERATAAWPLVGGQAEIVAAEFTEGQLQAARLRVEHALQDDGRLVTIGDGNRSNDMTASGERVISITVARCERSLLTAIGRAAGDARMVEVTKGQYFSFGAWRAAPAESVGSNAAQTRAASGACPGPVAKLPTFGQRVVPVSVPCSCPSRRALRMHDSVRSRRAAVGAAMRWVTAARHWQPHSAQVIAVYRVGDERSGQFSSVFARSVPTFCGRRVANASLGIELVNPSEHDSGSQGDVVVARFPGGWQVWGAYHP